MKKTLSVIACAVIALACFTGCSKDSKGSSDAGIEPDAKVVLGIDNDEWGAAVVALWDETYPELAGTVSYVNEGAAGFADKVGQLQGDAPDVCFVIDGEVARNEQSLKELSAPVATVAEKVSQDPFYSNTNKEFNKFVPIAYDGMVFAWNKTMMDAMGMDTTDKDGDGLPEAFDTWEEIFAWSKVNTGNVSYKGKRIDVCFPLSIMNQWAMYSSFTSDGWNIYADGDATNPGFEKESFLKSFDFITAAADARLSLEENGILTPGESMAWRWDDVLNANLAPFGLVGTWMDVKSAEATLGEDFKFSAMPTFKGHHLSPLVKTKGFVVNGFTKYPLASEKLLKLLIGKSGMQTMVEKSSYIPSLKAGAPNTPDYGTDTNKKEMSAGFAFNYPEPSMSLPNNPAMKSMQVYYNIAIEQSYLGVWDGTVTPKEAQAEIVKNAAAWLEANN